MSSRRPASPEPNAGLPLRWSTYAVRQPLGSLLLVAGAAMVLPMSASTAALGLIGSAVHAAGWLILPARGGRRALAAVASLLSLYLMLLGTQLAALVAVPLALWFLVRRRPGIAYPLTLAPAIVGLLLTQLTGPYGARIPVLAATTAVAVVAAWVASRLPRNGRLSSTTW